jgi:hypothetical protein
VIAALAFSCAPPLEETGYDWDAANARNDASKTDSLTDILVFGTSGSAVSAKNPTFDITFPVESDFLREDNFAASLKGFLTVNTFTNPDPAANPDGIDGMLSTLTSVDYTVENRAGNTVTLKVDKDYTAGTTDYSNLVIKIDSTKYKHSHGLLLDKDQNGKAGEAGYDDVYLEQYLNGAIITGATLPGNRGWSITIADFSGSFSWASAAATTSDKEDIDAIDTSASSFNGISNTTKGNAIFAEIAGLVTNNIKIERLGTNGAWTAEGATAVYEEGVGIQFKDFTAAHGAVYRITWSGSANLTSSGEYFGVKQRIRILGAAPDTNQTPYANNAKLLYALTKVSGNSGTVNNSGIITYITKNAAGFQTSVYSHDLDNKKVVLEVKVPWKGNSVGHATDPLVGLDSAKISSLTSFKASFKIIYSTNPVSDFKTDSFVYIDITKVEGILDQLTGGTASQTAINTLRITLDPAFSIPTNQTWVNDGGYWDHNNDYEETLYDWQYNWVNIANDDGDDFDENLDTSETYYYWDSNNSEYVAVDFDNDVYDSDTSYYTRVQVSYTQTNHDGDQWVGSGHWAAIPDGDFYFLINDGFGYTGGKYLYGSLDNYAYDNFELYDIN